MLHIVFEEKGGTMLRTAQEMDDSLRGEVLVVTEDWSAGPIMGLIKDGNTISRKEWLSDNLRVETEDMDITAKISSYLKENEAEVIWLWIAPNARDVCGYYYLISQFKKYQGKIYTIWLNNLPFLNDKGLVFYPAQLSEIPSKEFLKAKRLAQMVTGAVFETDPDEWEKLKVERSFLRLLDGRKKIVSKPADFYDRILLDRIKNNWQRGDKIVREAMREIKVPVNENFLSWRVRELVSQNFAEVKGMPQNSDNFEVKLFKTEEKVIDE